MSSVYQPRRPRASPLWQLVHHGWNDFLADYEKQHRKSLGPLPSSAVTTVQSFLRCGDLASGFTRLQCPDCGHERLLAFTCKGRHFCPSCHQRRVRSTSEWIATSVCHEVPHRQFVFTIPKVLRVIFRKRRKLLAWKHSGFSIHHGGEQAVPAHDAAGRKRLAEYLLRHPFSLQKITWNATTKTVIYRSKRHHTTKRNFEIFKAPDFIAAALLHLPPKGQQTVRYYGLYSNKSRGQTSPIPDRIIRPSQPETPPTKTPPAQMLLIPAPPKCRARDMRPLWRDLILKVWGGDPLQCPCCPGTMKRVRTFLRPEEIQFFLSLHGLWEGVITLPRPPPPPFDIDTMEPVEPLWQAIKEWIPDDDPDLNWFNQERQPKGAEPESYDQSPTWQPVEVPLGDGRILVLDDS